MKCRLIREMEINVSVASPELLAKCEQRGKFYFAPIGTELDDPECYWLVRMGKAEAADEECQALTEQTPEERAKTIHAADRLSAGIHPEDFELYDAGYISGYNADGSFRPGPNWDQWQSEKSKATNDGI